MFLSFQTDKSGQTVQTQIKLLLEEKTLKKGHNSATTNLTEKKRKYGSAYFFIHIQYIKFQNPISNRYWLYAKPKAPRTDGQAQTNMHPQLLWSWGHKNWPEA